MTARTREELVALGWPDSVWGPPTADEAERIELVYNEISLHEVFMPDDHAWFLAGQVVARFDSTAIVLCLKK